MTFSPAVEAAIRAAHQKHPDVPAEVIRAIITVESGGKVSAYREERGGDGSIGLMQIRLSTARALGFQGTREDLFLPAVNVEYGTRFLRDLYRRLGDWQSVASAYNGGIRPNLGFGARVSVPTRVVLARDASGKPITYYTAQPGQFGNQPYVDKFLKALGPVAASVLTGAAQRTGAETKAGSGVPAWPFRSDGVVGTSSIKEVGMFGKFLSRRFLISLGALVAQTLGVHIPPEVMGVIGAYVGGESLVDAARAWKNGNGN